MISAFSYYSLGRLMQEFLPHILVNHTWGLHQAVDLAHAPRSITVEHQPGHPIRVPDPTLTELLPAELRAAFKPGIEKIREEVVKLQLKSSYATLHRMLESLDKSDCTVRGCADDAEELHGRLVDELKYTTCLALWGRTEELYRAQQLFGKEVADQFPSAAVDIEESGKCLAFDRATACVFHLMRVLEVGLQALAADLGIAKVERNWQQLLQDVDAKVRALPFKTDVEKTGLAERSAAVAHLRNVKDAWRNDVMHPRDVYTVEQATDIFNHTKALMCSLATFLTWPVP